MEFKHVRPSNVCPQYSTIAIESPSIDELLNVINYVRYSSEIKVDIHMGLSLCSLKDNFSKVVGRKLAAHRFEIEDVKTLTLEEYTFVKGYDYNILYTIFSYANYMITFRSYISVDYNKTDCHTISYI